MENEGPEPQDKLAVYAAVKSACETVGSDNSLVGAFTVDTEAALLISELLYRKVEEAAEDVELFAAHAKRNNVSIDDVKLLFRKNEKILDRLKQLEEADEADKPPVKRKRSEAEPEPNPS